MAGRVDRDRLLTLEGRQRHDAILRNYNPGLRTDEEVLRDTHRFIRGPGDGGATWEERLAQKYYDKLFKEYAIADLSRAAEGALGLRWRTQAEVVSGKGQFVCGGRGCGETAGLASFELLFSYREAGESKASLVKLRACASCVAPRVPPSP